MKKLFSFTLMLVAAGLFGMGSQGVLYELAGDLVNKMVTWSNECGGKTDADCSRNLTALRKAAYKAAEFPADMASDDSDDKSQDGEAVGNGKAGWKAHWRLYEQLFKYHGECFNRYDADKCRAEWAAFEKEQQRCSRLYGEEPRWADFPDALKERVFKPIASRYEMREK
jgi:hypothetical protein